jgi:hypothetical protein|eukprot:SAG25_NODE_947_length_4626_cov_2.304838_2_plen_59_part_00
MPVQVAGLSPELLQGPAAGRLARTRTPESTAAPSLLPRFMGLYTVGTTVVPRVLETVR